jgi:hypothetical protein
MDIEKIKESAWIIYQLEIGLREFIIDTFDRFYNNDAWHEHDQNSNPLAPKMLVYIEEKKTSQKKSDLVNLNNLHPLYYLTFGHLHSILNRKSNNNAFETCFSNLKIKELINKSFELLLPLRNKVAHSIALSDEELKQLSNAYNQIKQYIPVQKILQDKLDNSNTRNKIIEEIEFILDQIEISKVDINLLGNMRHHHQKTISKYLILRDEYLKLWLKRGSTFKIRDWVMEKHDSLKQIKKELI